MDRLQRAISISDQLLAEWPDLYIEVTDGNAPIVRVYGARKLVGEQLARAEALKGPRDLDIQVESVEFVYCAKSVAVKMFREIGEPPGKAASIVKEDGRGVGLMCNNEDGHAAHDWGNYRPLRKD